MDPGLDQLSFNDLRVASILVEILEVKKHRAHRQANKKERLLVVDGCLCLLPPCWDAEVPGLTVLVVDRQVERRPRYASKSMMPLDRRGKLQG